MSRCPSPSPGGAQVGLTCVYAAKASGVGVSKRAAEFLGVSQSTIRKFVAEGKLPAYHIGEKLVKFDPADLDKYFAANRVDNS